MNEEQKIINLVSNILGISPNEVKAESHLKDDLNAQDLEITDLLLQLEKEFSVQFSPDETKNIETIQDIIDLVKIS